MTKLFQFKEWLKYQFIAENAYTIHSPFLYQFWENVIKPARKDTLYDTHISSVFKELCKNNTYLKKQDLGTGKNTGHEQVSYIAKTSSVRPKFGHILHQLVKYFKPQIMIELGTCLGISTLYMLHDFEGTHFYSIEGSPARQNIAKSHLETLKKQNLILLQNSFEKELPSVLAKHNTIDLIFIDGNHTFEATQEYFTLFLPYMNEKSILVFDDIHWSKDMLNVWEYIYQHPKVSLTIDVFQFGICFFNSNVSKENKILRY